MSDPVFGVDYYPEHWGEVRWPFDAELMRQAGINTVRLAEFAWSRLEPERDSFDFSWLDRAIDMLATRDISVILGTPTAAPPAWLIDEYPEILPVNEDGQRAGFGMRRHYCPTQPSFQEATRRIVTAMARHYAANPAVVAWQTDNELGNIANGGRCHCSCCRDAFHQWLWRRYGSLDELNRRWGTVFWSQEYSAWDQIPLPMRNVRTGAPGSAHNPGLYLDFARFSSDCWVRYQQVHLSILRAICPDHTITHNMMGLFPLVDAAELAHDLDIVSWDNYPRLPGPWSPLDGGWDPRHIAMSHDLMRGVKGRTFWVMEQQSGASGWGTLSPAPLPGEIRLWTLQAAARGAEGIVYFRWRTARTGTEQYWHGILPHHGRPGRRFEEVQRVGEEIRRIGNVLKTPLPVSAAILRSYDTLWALEAQPTAQDLQYDEQISRYYRALWQRQVPVDLITDSASLLRYRLLIAPCLFVLRAETAARLRDWVEGGGTLVLTFRSGVKDEANAMFDSPLPGPLMEAAGVEVADYTALLREATGEPSGGPEALRLLWTEPECLVRAGIWMDELAPREAEVLARYRGEPYDGAAAITRNHYGAGRVFYVGTSLDDAGHALLLERVLREAGIAPGPAAPDGVEMLRRVLDEVDHWFILNHTGGALQVEVPAPGFDLLSRRQMNGTVTLQARDVIVLRVGAEAADSPA